MSSYPVSIGDLVAGKYLVERFLGEGGMGVVVAARHLELDQPVAIKFLLPEIAEHLTAAQRFRREARAAARIRGDHACRILDVATLDNGVPYIVMEYLEGCDLATEIRRRRRLPFAEAVDYILQACEVLAEAHAGGIVHRDLKPGNFFLAMRADGARCLKVLDFGVSKLLTDVDVAPLGLTGTATMIGSPLYMSPEQFESAKDVDGRTDIWGLGVVLYELITGRTPFLAESLAQLTNQVLSTQPPSCASLGIQIPARLESVLLRALSKQRDNRFASVADFARALVPYGPFNATISPAHPSALLHQRPWLAGSGSSSGVEPPFRDSSTPAWWERKLGRVPRKRRLGLAAMLVALLVLAGIAYRFAAGKETGPAASAPNTERTLPPQAVVEHAVTPAELPTATPSAPGSDMEAPPSAGLPGAQDAKPASQIEPASPRAAPPREPAAQIAPAQAAAPPRSPVARSFHPRLRGSSAVAHEQPSQPPPAPLRITDFGGRR